MSRPVNGFFEGKTSASVMRKLVYTIVFCAAIAGASCSQQPAPEARTFTRFSMGTVVEYTLVASSNEMARRAVDAAEAEIARMSSLLWEGDTLSAIYRLNTARDTVTIEQEAAAFLIRSRAYYDASAGAFDPTIKPVFDLYDFSEESTGPPADDDIDERLGRVGLDGLEVTAGGAVKKARPDVEIGVGGVAKGLAVDLAIEAIRQMGIESAIVNAGGDLRCIGTNMGTAWRVGIQDPDDPSMMAAVLALSDAAVATSGDYQQYIVHDGVRYHHILDPRTGRPVHLSRSATVVAPTAEQADALATALFVLGPLDGIAMIDRIGGVEGMVIDPKSEVHYSAGFRRFLSEAMQTD